MRAYIKELENTVKTMHQDLRQSYSIEKVKEVITDIMKDEIANQLQSQFDAKFSQISDQLMPSQSQKMSQIDIISSSQKAENEQPMANMIQQMYEMFKKNMTIDK